MSRGQVALLAGLLVAGLAVSCSDDAPNDFEAGECTTADLAGLTTEIETVECDQEHAAEAYAQFDLSGDEFPGLDEINAEAEDRCITDLFEDYVGLPYEESIYLATYLGPTEESWGDGDRTVICIINGTNDGSPLEGSAEGTGR